jgi:dihydrofolate synthase/folylpolyglutamate synthase
VDYPEAIKYLYSLRLFGVKLGLGNTRHLLSNLGHPEGKFFTIHVAGTDGKGSVCAMAHSILSAAGYKTGLFTSPHILSFRERIRIGHNLISEQAVGDHLGKVFPIIRAMSDDPALSHPTFFEVVTVLAVDYFAANNVEIAVMETGLGGRLDATNALPSKIQVITSIGLEHTAHLGNSIPEIAAEKAGIIKEEATVIVGEEDEAALGVIRRVAEEKGARTVLFGRDIAFRNRKLSFPVQELDIITSQRTYPKIVLPLLGRHQAANCCLAVAVAEELERRGFEIELEDIYRGIKETRWPGRFEVIPGKPIYILDAACNPHACKALAETLLEVVQGAPLTLVAGFLRDKDYRAMCELLFPTANNIILTEPKSDRALPVEELSEAVLPLAAGKELRSFSKLEEAIAYAGKVAPSTDSYVCITGSNYLLGAARKALGLDDLPEDFILSESFDGKDAPKRKAT